MKRSAPPKRKTRVKRTNAARKARAFAHAHCADTATEPFSVLLPTDHRPEP